MNTTLCPTTGFLFVKTAPWPNCIYWHPGGSVLKRFRIKFDTRSKSLDHIDKREKGVKLCCCHFHLWKVQPKSLQGLPIKLQLSLYSGYVYWFLYLYTLPVPSVEQHNTSFHNLGCETTVLPRWTQQLQIDSRWLAASSPYFVRTEPRPTPYKKTTLSGTEGSRNRVS